MTTIFNKLIAGNAFFMFPILFLLIFILVLIVQGLIKKDKQKKFISLVFHLGNITLAWGVLGMTIGLIQAFDYIQELGGVSQAALSGGLKVALLAPAFGLITFLIARIGIILIVWKGKEAENNS